MASSELPSLGAVSLTVSAAGFVSLLTMGWPAWLSLSVFAVGLCGVLVTIARLFLALLRPHEPE